MLTGAQTLTYVDEALTKLRARLADLDAQMQDVGSKLTSEQRRELELYGRLAELRLETIRRDDLEGERRRGDAEVQALIEQRDAAAASLKPRLEAAEAALARSEAERLARQRNVEAASAELDRAESEAQRRLSEDADYRAALERARLAALMAEQSEAKAGHAAEDRAEKGRPYETDPLFNYLWKRGYGTSAYRANPLARLLDAWVARLCGYRASRPNYARLLEIPERLAEHAKRQQDGASATVAALDPFEERAADAADVPERRSALEAAQAAVRETDTAIMAQEAELNGMMEQRAAFAEGRDEFSERGARILEDALRRDGIRVLRDRAARTADPEDDVLVDELADVQDERKALEGSFAQQRALHANQLAHLHELEDVRRQFKSRQYDDVHSEFANSALLAAMFVQFLRGETSGNALWQTIEREQRYRRVQADPRFGSARYRGPQSSPWRIPGGGQWRMPRRGGGGFKTGGGF